MSLQKEAEAFEVLAQKLDVAFQKGAFGLADALQLVPAINTQAALYNANPHELLSRFVHAAAPADATHQDTEYFEQSEPEVLVAKDENTIPGTTHRVAKPRQ
ncbi:hypothetical protein [Dyadobacter chenhuakuii]|uniref:Uncharacterized protein n=1 Tax=Dyadobacter chenhuakuii TaxID=2909339 RepID=A0A9X1QAY7_9BACT|nr:hypothetical protein [Dyadobacter chenhuakuii]MCF2498390.1 hypothetical protein [Dyadobacter chenhuakuii]